MWWIVVLLILIGIALLVLEILVIPGAGFAGVVGFAMMVAGVWMAYKHIGIMEGNIVLISTIVLNVAGLVYAVRSKTWKKAMLKTEISGKVNEINSENIKVGDKGVTVSRCAPMGKAIINGDFIEVGSMSEFIDQDTEIEIIRIQGNKVFIKQFKDS
jgi:membrane-bound ClpP family serine protease